MGTPSPTAKPLPAPPAAADDTFQAFVKNRQAALARLGARRGLQSTFLGTTAPGTSTLIGGGS